MSKIEFPLVTRNLGAIDPESLEAYAAVGGYASLKRALTEMTSEAVLEAVDKSGLRGRGGGGFPTGRKWRFCREAPGEQKFIICNGSEGDPGAFMDRAVMEGDPHAIVEGMAIGAYAIGAGQGFIYVRPRISPGRHAAAPGHRRRPGSRVSWATRSWATPFSFDIQVRRGAGAYVCGEETALINFIEGNIGEPRNRPPYPAQQGLWGQPTIINNVETWANVPVIIAKGAEWFAAIGTENSKGTKVFSVAGGVKKPGIVEVPMGTPLRQIIYDLGGGIKKDREFKAVHHQRPRRRLSCPSSSWTCPWSSRASRPPAATWAPAAWWSWTKPAAWWMWPAISWSSPMRNPAANAPPAGKAPSSCWRSSPRSPKATARKRTSALMEELCATMAAASICGLGQSAVNPVLSTLKYFREEYEAHVREKKCPALVCRPLLKYTVDPETCTGCLACLRECQVGAITGDVEEPQEIDQELCVKCGMCHAVCKFDAVKVES